ncbi:MAG: hypothetical protein ABI193_26150 [Minicystis sp.]
MKLQSLSRPALGLLLGALLFPTSALAQFPPQPPPPQPMQPMQPMPPQQQLPPLGGPPMQPGPPQGWQGQPPPAPPPPGAWQPPSGGWQQPGGPPPMDTELPPDLNGSPPEGVTAKGLPYSQRGGLFFDAAGLLVAKSSSSPISALELRVSIPVSDRTFVEGFVPFVFGALGNPMLGVRHVFRPGKQLWINLHGALGFPLVNTRNFDQFSAAKGLWDIQEYAVTTLPFALGSALEYHTGIVELRAEIDPNFGVSIAKGQSHLFVLQHAFEAQFGHSIGGGLRYQGVAFGTASNPLDDGDHYQGAFEPFFVIRKNPLFFRLGILLPLDKELGKPFDRSWGMRATTGWSFE